MTGLKPVDQARLTAGASMWMTAQVADNGVEALRMSDGPMGIASGRVDERDIGRLTPCPLSLGASFDIDLVARVGTLVGSEAIRARVDLVLAPNVNLARSPLAGRAFEYFSEDPLLAGLAGAAWVRGVQSAGVAATPKHLVCNDSETDRDNLNVLVDARALREVYLLPFELCASAGAAAILTAYNRVNGAWCSEAGDVTSIVKSEWGFAGPLISDWFGTHSTAGALNGGLDLEMPGPARFLGEKALDAVNAGEVAPERLADAAARVAGVAARFAGPKTPPGLDADALLIEAAAAGMVLLRNADDVLPLAPGAVKRLAVIGPNAASPCYQGGTFAKISLSPHAPRPLEAIRARYGAQTHIVYEPGVDPQPRLPGMRVAPTRDLGDGCGQGMTLDYFADGDLSGSPRFSETRDTNSLVWFVGVHDQGLFDRPAGVRASGWFTPAQDGPHRIFVGGTGALALRVDGKLVFEKTKRPVAKDVMGALKRGDADQTAVDLVAGQRVLVEIEMTYDAARVHGLWYGVAGPDSAETLLARAVSAARDADAVVLVVGETSDSSVESKDRADTQLPAEQLALIDAVCAVNPRTIVVVNVGHAFDARFGEAASVLLSAWYPGEAFGPALAEVLAGDREPGGRLPVTLARAEGDYPAFDLTPGPSGALPYDDGVLIGYRGFLARGVEPLHAFGAGFGYTRFEWLKARSDGLSIWVTVRNDGARRGGDILQLYRQAPEPALVGFARVTLEPGETAEVRVDIEPRLLRRWTPDGWRAIGESLAINVSRSATAPVFMVETAIPPDLFKQETAHGSRD